ncbi:MAG: hypothetical protein HQ567_00555 [Candidatus Nealsonbacteria bacterium]|nr:hypothetical protein [Candidatus Nealsonbacteria bacterium]
MAVALFLVPALLPAAEVQDEAAAGHILNATGVQGGLIVHLGCGDGTLTAALRPSDAYIVHALDRLSPAVRLPSPENLLVVDGLVACLKGKR